MTQEALVESLPELPAGEAKFIRPSEGKGLLQHSERDSYVKVDIPELRPAIRGRLAWLLKEAIERSLELRGACGPGIGAAATLETSLSDQLYRARLIGARGITMIVPTLEGITSRSGALDADDSATLRFWICATRRRPVRLYLDVADCLLGAYLDPVTLTQLMHAESPLEPNSPPVVVEWVDGAGSATQELTNARRSIESSPAAGSAPPISDVVACGHDSSLALSDVMACGHDSSHALSDVVACGHDSSHTLSDVVVCGHDSSHDPSEPQWGGNQLGKLDQPQPTETARDPEVLQTCLAPPPISIPPDTALEPPPLDPSLVAPPPISIPPDTALELPPLDPSLAPPPISIPPDTALELPPLDPSLAPPPLTALIDSAPLAILAEAASELAEVVNDLAETNLTPIAAPAVTDLQRSSSPTHDPPAPGSIHSLPTIAPQCLDDDTSEPAFDTPSSRDLILPAPHPPTIPVPELASSVEEPLPKVAAPEHEPLRADAPDSWRAWMQRLDAVHGPKPLNLIEQLFINAYVPLCDAYHRGITGEECRPVLDHWASSFSQSYSEAFDAMRIRGRRPMMVLDIAETAQRLARLHGARSAQLVLVDAMRFDLGLRVERILSAKLGREAILTDRFLLWSALPTTTTQQLELIARGAESLRDGDIHSDTPVLVARGRSASTLRRVRAGSRELLKLDLVEARLGEAGPPLAERLDQLAVEVSEALASAIGRLQPRTLVTVFGDHGFCLDPVDQGTAPMRHGGASPDEVLVPAFAWLVGQTH